MSIEAFDKFRVAFLHEVALGFSLDVSRIAFPPDFFPQMEHDIGRAISEMAGLERGVVANPDEKRMVGHYWLRAPELAPRAELREAIEQTLSKVVAFTGDIHTGKLTPEKGERFSTVLVIGIGGSALGPELCHAALGGAHDKMRVFFFDNTDPDGMDRTLDAIGDRLNETLVVVISKSGGTKETRNGMLEARAAFERKGLSFGKHAVAVTGEGSKLDEYAQSEGFLARFPMWDWVGGRTSEMSAVGLLPAALQGIDVHALLDGARAMDETTRRRDFRQNPAAMLALAWFSATGGVGRKDMVILPYKDRLELFSKYLQQLVMESLGKWLDLDGNEVGQGIAVYGNKGSTDQHAYVQQLRDGLDNFFVTFIEVLRERAEGRPSIEVEPGITSGDYLAGFLQGTRQALWERGRESITITIDHLDARSLGMLIALYERAVGLYATLVNINAYHQPGVEAGKKAAEAVLELQARVVGALRATKGAERTLQEVTKAAGSEDMITVLSILRHLAANPEKGVRSRIPGGKSILEAVWSFEETPSA